MNTRTTFTTDLICNVKTAEFFTLRKVNKTKRVCSHIGIYAHIIYVERRGYMGMNDCNTMCRMTDYGGQPLIVNIDRFAKSNPYFRTALWTGERFQVTLMSIPVGSDIGIEMHPNVDQFLRIEDGCALVIMGQSENALNYRKNVNSDYAVIVPAGTWHNIINTGNRSLKLYSVYAPPQHPLGTVHKTKAEVEHH